MKKNLLKALLYALIIMSFSAKVYSEGAETEKEKYDNKCKIQYIKDDGYWYLNGFDFGKYKPGDPGLEELTEAAYEKVNMNLAEKENYVIVGHSQGGAGALAYAILYEQYNSKIKEEELRDKRLKGIITVSGIDRGLPALKGGFAPLKAKITDDVNILYSALIGTVGAVPFLDYVAFGLLSLDRESVATLFFSFIP